MPLCKYEPILQEINLTIERFNQFLADEFKIAPLNGSNAETCSVIIDIPWDDQVWPCKDGPGVYILCARNESDPDRLGAYVGKASLSNIGNRLWAHLNPHRITNSYRMNNGVGESFIIEAIAAIAFTDHRMRALVTALEEFIISGVKNRVHLLNRTGNATNLT
jgi:hypothetical protein